MNTPDKEWWIAQAGEYVLGTLDYADWVTFNKTIEHDREAQQLVVEWERTLQPLADSLAPMEPGDQVWDAIDTRLFGTTRPSSSVTQIGAHRATTQSLERKIDRWRGYAGLATAASLLLASLAWVNHLGVRDQVVPEPAISVAQFDAISIVRDAESSPLWVVDAALNDGFVRVTAIAPPAIDNSKSYELWIVKPDNAGVQSMGLIPHEIDQSYLLKVSAVNESPVAFAVSLEPAGGSTQDVPSGPVLYQGVYQSLKL